MNVISVSNKSLVIVEGDQSNESDIQENKSIQSSPENITIDESSIIISKMFKKKQKTIIDSIDDSDIGQSTNRYTNKLQKSMSNSNNSINKSIQIQTVEKIVSDASNSESLQR